MRRVCVWHTCACMCTCVCMHTYISEPFYVFVECTPFKVPLCGYGGVSRLEVGGVIPSPSSVPPPPGSGEGSGGQSCLDLGEVRAGQGIKLNVLLYNSGPRAAFVHAACCGLEGGHAPFPDSHAHLVPSRVVIAPHSTEELPLFYRPTKAEEEKCRVSKSPLARLVLEFGDEVVRQRLVWAVRKEVEEGGGEGEGEGRAPRTILTPTCREFVKEFTQHAKIASGKKLEIHENSGSGTCIRSPIYPRGLGPKMAFSVHFTLC